VAEPLAEVHLDYPVNTLVSYHYFSKANIKELANGGLCVIADSGAFSAASQGAEIDTEAFYEWCRKWKNDFVWMAALDVIGDEQATYKNWIQSPPGLGLVPTVHYGAAPNSIDKYAEAGVDLIGLGGMVPHKSEPMKLLRWALGMMRYARDKHPQVRFHGWGVTHPQLMMNLPWWSVDSSGFTSAYRYGRMVLVDPSTGKKETIAMDGRSAAKHATMIQANYGISWKRIAQSTSGNRKDVVRASARSMQHLQSFLQKRWQVTPPTHLTDKRQEVGPLMHFVDAAQQHLKHLHGPQLHYVVVNAKAEAEYLTEEQQ
jgi:hypothetical protein